MAKPCKPSGWMRGPNPDADVGVCPGACDGRGDPVPLAEAPLASAEPYPGDDGKYRRRRLPVAATGNSVFASSVTQIWFRWQLAH